MMLEELHIRDLALIDEAWIEFGPGMTVLTGETGAGKTVLLGALKLLLGERGDAGSVRTGAPEALVEGRFGDGQTDTVVRRRVTADGRSRCTLDGEMATVGALGDRIGPLVDLHGQHEHQALLSTSTHMGYLDRWAEECGPALERYRLARAAWKDSVDTLERLKRDRSQSAADADRLRRLVDEVDAVGPLPGEDAELEARLPALKHAERLSEAAATVVSAVRGDQGASDRLAEAAAALSRVAGIDPALDAVAESLTEAAAIIDDAGTTARSYRDGIEHDPAALDRVLSRLSTLASLTRAHGPSLDEVVRRRDEALMTLAALDDGGEAVEKAERAAADARLAYESAAGELAAVREVAGPRFAAAVMGVMAELAMDGGRIEVAFTHLPFDSWTADGPHRVEFLYAAAPVQPARPLARIASGGEISRVMLAMKGVLGERDTAPVLVFDEVDAGIGGATATAVGSRLASLARSHQVIVVTHLAQVAAFANSHLVVRKIVDGEDAATTVVPVEGDTRVVELARMLSGNDSEASRAHAIELLEAAPR